MKRSPLPTKHVHDPDRRKEALETLNGLSIYVAQNSFQYICTNYRKAHDQLINPDEYLRSKLSRYQEIIGLVEADPSEKDEIEDIERQFPWLVRALVRNSRLAVGQGTMVVSNLKDQIKFAETVYNIPSYLAYSYLYSTELPDGTPSPSAPTADDLNQVWEYLMDFFPKKELAYNLAICSSVLEIQKDADAPRLTQDLDLYLCAVRRECAVTLMKGLSQEALEGVFEWLKQYSASSPKVLTGLERIFLLTARYIFGDRLVEIGLGDLKVDARIRYFTNQSEVIDAFLFFHSNFADDSVFLEDFLVLTSPRGHAVSS